MSKIPTGWSKHYQLATAVQLVVQWHNSTSAM